MTVICNRCGSDFELEEGQQLVRCPVCFPFKDDFDADELGLDPEEEYDA